MTDNEIIKALECCACSDGCENCLYAKQCDGVEHLTNALDLINRQKAKNEALQMDNQQLQSDIINENQNYDHIKGLWEVEKEKVEKAKQKVINVCKELQTAKAEIERLEKEHNNGFEKWKILDERTKERYEELYQEAKGVVRTEAIKEFAERLKLRFSSTLSYSGGAIARAVDKLVKEMTEQKG